MRRLAPASSAGERSRVNVSPVLALAGLVAIGLLATRLPRLEWRRLHTLDLVFAAGGPLVLAGLILGPGIDFLTRPVLQAMAPVTALAIGWIGATLGAHFEWRYVRRIPRAAWLLAGMSATAAFAVVAFVATLLARGVPALGAAWMPRLPSVLTLAAVAAASGPGVVALVARAAGIRPRIARIFALAAALETAAGALLVTVPFALHRPHGATAGAELGWLAWLVFAVGSGALVGMVFLSISRLRPARADIAVALLGTLVFGAGVGYAAELSPFVVCALATGLVVNLSPRRHVVRQLLSDWEHPMYAVFLVVAGALLVLPTGWILAAAALLAALRVAAQWGAVRLGRDLVHLSQYPSNLANLGLATVAQGGAALAIALNFSIMYGGQGAVLTTVVVGVALAQLAAPPLVTLAQGSAATPARAPERPR